MYILDIVLTPLLSLFILFVLTKLMGYRQVAQLNMYDYITGITFGNIAANLITNGLDDYERPLAAMVIYTVFTVLISHVTRKSSVLRHYIEGPAIILYENDQIYNTELTKAKMDIDELLMQCRQQGYFNLKELDTIVLETNGSLSFYPKEEYRPAQVGDLGITVQEVPYPTLIVKEGKINQEAFAILHKDRHWLKTTLKNRNIALADILLMYQEENTNIQIFTKNTKTRNFK